MCGLCGSLGQGPTWEDEPWSDDPSARWRLRRDAQETAAELTRLLAASRVRVDANPDFGFVVTLPTGGVEIVSGIAGVWHALDALRIAIPDPLQG